MPDSFDDFCSLSLLFFKFLATPLSSRYHEANITVFVEKVTKLESGEFCSWNTTRTNRMLDVRNALDVDAVLQY